MSCFSKNILLRKFLLFILKVNLTAKQNKRLRRLLAADPSAVQGAVTNFGIEREREVHSWSEQSDKSRIQKRLKYDPIFLFQNDNRGVVNSLSLMRYYLFFSYY